MAAVERLGSGCVSPGRGEGATSGLRKGKAVPCCPALCPQLSIYGQCLPVLACRGPRWGGLLTTSGRFQCPPRGGLWAPMWTLPQGDTWQWDNGLKCRSDCNPGKIADPGACGAWRRACLLCVGDSGRLHGGGDFGAGTIWQVIKKWQLVP